MESNALIRSQLQALFVFKAPATVIGWIWKAALVMSIQILLQPRWRMSGRAGAIRERTSSDGYEGKGDHPPRPLFVLLSYFIVYAALLVLCELLQRFMKRRMETASLTNSITSDSSSRRLHQTRHQLVAFRRKVLAMGLGLIPAWGFKDVVGSFITWMKTMLPEIGRKKEFLPSLIVLAFSVAMAILLPQKKEGAPFCISILGSVNASLGLGVAYAFNQIVKDFAGDNWATIWFQVVYVPIITVIVTFCRPPLLEANGRVQSSALKKLFEFLAGTSAYLVAWSWNQLLISAGDAVWKEDVSGVTEMTRQLLWAVVVTGLAGVAIALLPTPHQGQTGLESLAAVTVLSAGVNVGSFWSNFISLVYDLWRAHYEFRSDLLLCWALVAIITIIVPPFAFLLDKQLEPKVGTDENEIQKQVQLTDDGDGGGSFVPGTDGE